MCIFPQNTPDLPGSQRIYLFIEFFMNVNVAAGEGQAGSLQGGCEGKV